MINHNPSTHLANYDWKTYSSVILAITYTPFTFMKRNNNCLHQVYDHFSMEPYSAIQTFPIQLTSVLPTLFIISLIIPIILLVPPSFIALLISFVMSSLPLYLYHSSFILHSTVPVAISLLKSSSINSLKCSLHLLQASSLVTSSLSYVFSTLTHSLLTQISFLHLFSFMCTRFLTFSHTDVSMCILSNTKLVYTGCNKHLKL